MLGHEVSHVANGDMVTLTLIQGVVNTFVFVASRVDRQHRRQGRVPERARPRPGVLDHDDRSPSSCSAFLATMIVMWFSRQREFRADGGGARLAGPAEHDRRARGAQARAHANRCRTRWRLRHQRPASGQGLKRLFMSHPPIEERIAALRPRRTPESARACSGEPRRSVRCRHDPPAVALRDARGAQGPARPGRLAGRRPPTALPSKPTSAACTAAARRSSPCPIRPPGSPSSCGSARASGSASFRRAATPATAAARRRAPARQRDRAFAAAHAQDPRGRRR